jgi:hypothetical protein
MCFIAQKAKKFYGIVDAFSWASPKLNFPRYSQETQILFFWCQLVGSWIFNASGSARNQLLNR